MTKGNSLIADLERALGSGSERHREEILSRVTDLFFASAPHYSTEQIKLFGAILSTLITAIEPMARARLATRLAPARNAPADVVRMLAFDDNIEVARPMLTKSECLSDADLVENANSKSQQHLVAISERKDLSEDVTDVLVTRGNQEVAYSVSKNQTAHISYAGFRTLMKRSIDDDKLALLVGAREDMPRQHYLQLIDQASDAVRARLLAENLGDNSAVESVVQEITTALRNDAQSNSENYAAVWASLEAMHRAGKLNEAAVQGFAKRQQLVETAVALMLLCGVERDIVERALLAPGSDVLIILAKLAGFSWTTAKAILLLKAGSQATSEQDLEQAKASFDRLQRGTARNMLGFFLSHLGAK